MSKIVLQYRYYDDVTGTNSKNLPTTLTRALLSSGSAFFNNSYGSILLLGILSLPGIKFYLNKGADPIIIGSTGIYELDLEGLTEISALAFDTESLKLIKDNTNASLIVDAIYSGED